MSTLKIVRRTSQIVLAVALAAIAWENAHGWERLSGNLLAFSAYGYPLADPLAALQVLSASRTLPWRMALGGATALAVALVLGTVFCSWVCPFGLLSELLRESRGQDGRASGKDGGGVPARAGTAPSARAPGANAYFRKAAVWGAALAAVVLLGLPPLINQLSLPGWYTRIFQTWFIQGEAAWLGLLLLGSALTVEAFTGRRLWCRYVCPQSLLLNLMHRISPFGLRVRFQPGRCTCAKGEEQCERACSLDLTPRRAGRGLEWECSTCGDCAEACKARGKALRLGFFRR